MQTLNQITIPVWPLEDNTIVNNVSVTYRQYGLPIGTAPVILINHSLNGDSDCMFHWDGVIGKDKSIDLSEYTVISIDIPGNEVAKEIRYDHLPFDKISARDVAVLFWLTLFELEIDELFAVIGADLGGGIAWEMTTLFPKRVLNLISIASSPITENWLVKEPIAKNEFIKSVFYSVDISRNRHHILEVAQLIKSNIHVIYVKNDSNYDKRELRRFYTKLSEVKKNVNFYELDEIEDTIYLKKNIEQVDRVVDGILEKEYVNNVA
ncbi:alpha/beta fold hydrolase [Faecalibacter macacae]|uniref:Alpha/beta fold hydrolase n=1 Tax=Faecalibacter macacae TaxID=1859289 RepID=A0A3L9MC88_9FLAO|nr:alpha/beta fold hydrolase [Faecalibacter macacae]RLZ10665.1 alpha/beta fold hydrolase [Faecalibacter macacae]